MQGPFAPILGLLQAELNAVISGPMAPMVRSYLPQTWVFETDRGPLTLAADSVGRVSSFAGSVQERDVTIRIRYDRLVSALQTRDARRIPPAEAPQVAFHSQKGNVAFSFLRNQFGL
ncbi:MAG: hypothetical protein KGJ23_12845 [Euryarchaeota archaeon]|nr:hypothetical protein [Euryarchaeota archaeon]MDE1837487.1 hypothetical protein [Euryarchaeota archaeon]MDE1880557.1 hypothetical protein [Euryarchaeota archaeon]MDE2045547.1 hypothetical protein [Thermoplasmata archaeon]